MYVHGYRSAGGAVELSDVWIATDCFPCPIVISLAFQVKGLWFKSWSVQRSIFSEQKILLGKLCVLAGIYKYGSREQTSPVKIPSV